MSSLNNPNGKSSLVRNGKILSEVPSDDYKAGYDRIFGDVQVGPLARAKAREVEEKQGVTVCK